MAKQTSRRNRQQRQPNIPASTPPAAASVPAEDAKPASSAPVAQAVNWKAEYGYVIKDLRRTLIIAGGMFALLIALNFVLN